jgi:hypothetical protein
MFYADLPPDRPRDPDELARALSQAAGDAPWSEHPELLREAWRIVAQELRADLRAGRLSLDDMLDVERARMVIADAADCVDVEWLHIVRERAYWRDFDEQIALARLADDGGN